MKVHLDFRGEGSSNRNAVRDESVETGDESVETGDESIEAREKKHSNHDIYIYIYTYIYADVDFNYNIMASNL